MGRQPTFKAIHTTDTEVNRLQDSLRETLGPVLSNTLLGAASFRFSEVDGVNGAPPTLALQFRDPGAQKPGQQTWTTVGHWDSTGTYHQP